MVPPLPICGEGGRGGGRGEGGGGGGRGGGRGGWGGLWGAAPPAPGPPPAVTVSLLIRMLREAFEGPPGPWTYFIDTSRGTGVFATIGGLSAAAASRPGGPAGTTIAGHVHRSEEHTSELQSRLPL